MPADSLSESFLTKRFCCLFTNAGDTDLLHLFGIGGQSRGLLHHISSVTRALNGRSSRHEFDPGDGSHFLMEVESKPAMLCAMSMQEPQASQPSFAWQEKQGIEAGTLQNRSCQLPHHWLEPADIKPVVFPEHDAPGEMNTELCCVPAADIKKENSDDELAEKKLHQCSHCNRGFKLRGNLVVHLRTHTGERPYKCAYCSRAFSRKTGLVEHTRTHTGDRPYRCDYCGSCFVQRSHLKVHVRMHTGDRPFSCDHCGAAFPQKAALVAHVRVHTGDRPYRCDQCGSAFAFKNNLVDHLRTHTGEKPYQCQLCPMVFAHHGTLVRHVRCHKGEKTFECGSCQKAFTDIRYLKQHMKTKHTKKNPAS